MKIRVTLGHAEILYEEPQPATGGSYLAVVSKESSGRLMGTIAAMCQQVKMMYNETQEEDNNET